MTRKYFGTDGIRGTVGKMPITPDFVLRLANAIGQILKKNYEKPVVLIGKDTRISGYMLESALEAGFNSAGVDVILLGPLPTPGVAYLTRTQRASLGIVISASHNPFPDNGLKFFNCDGGKLFDSWEQEVEKIMQEEPNWVKAKSLGKTRRLNDAAGRYIEFCKSTFNAGSLNNLKIVVDAANGATYQIIPKIYHELGAEVISIGCSPDGLNINESCGSTNPEKLIKAVLKNKADLGLALDGDGDRLIMVDEKGKIYNGDELLYILILGRLKQKIKIKGVIGTSMTNMALEIKFKELKIPFIRTDVGDRYILEELLKRNWQLGGESSGHLLILDKHSTGDGIISALEVLENLVKLNEIKPTKFSELIENLVLFPQVMENVKINSDFDYKNNKKLEKAKLKVIEKLNKNNKKGRVLIRKSGTESLLRIMVESEDFNQAKESAQYLVKSLIN